MTYIEVDGIRYVPESEVKSKAVNTDGLEYCIVRSDRAGVFAGWLKEHDLETQYAEVLNARRLWYWDGAASLSQLAVDGVKKPENCKFPCEVPTVHLSGVIEVIPTTESAKKSIEGVKVWKK